jgi:hypothetical protein
MEELIPNEENKVLFGNVVRSDGFCIEGHLAKTEMMLDTKAWLGC